MISDKQNLNYKKVLNFDSSSRAPSSKATSFIGEATSQSKSKTSRRSKIDKKKYQYFKKVLNGRLDLINIEN